MDGASSRPWGRHAVSAVFGILAAVAVALFGSLYGGLLVVPAFALVFRRAERVAAASVLAAFAAAWIVLVVAGVPSFPEDDTAVLVVVAGFVPIAISLATVLVVRLQSS